MLFDISCKLADLDLAQVHLLNLISFHFQLFQSLFDLWQCAHYLYYYQDIYLNIPIAYFQIQDPIRPRRVINPIHTHRDLYFAFWIFICKEISGLNKDKCFTMNEESIKRNTSLTHLPYHIPPFCKLHRDDLYGASHCHPEPCPSSCKLWLYFPRGRVGSSIGHNLCILACTLSLHEPTSTSFHTWSTRSSQSSFPCWRSLWLLPTPPRSLGKERNLAY